MELRFEGRDVIDVISRLNIACSTLTISEYENILSISGEPDRLIALLRDVVLELPYTNVGALHPNLPIGLSWKKPAAILLRELEALRANKSNAVLEIVASERVPESELPENPEWVDVRRFTHVVHLDGSHSGIYWYKNAKLIAEESDNRQSSPSRRG